MSSNPLSTHYSIAKGQKQCKKRGQIEKWLNSVPSIVDKSLSFGKENDWFTLYQAWAWCHRNLWHHVLEFIKKVPLSLGNWTVSWVDFGSWLLVVHELLGFIQVVVIFFFSWQRRVILQTIFIANLQRTFRTSIIIID